MVVLIHYKTIIVINHFHLYPDALVQRMICNDHDMPIADGTKSLNLAYKLDLVKSLVLIYRPIIIVTE